MNGEPMYRWASTDVLAAVVDVEMAVFLGHPFTKEVALLALAARREFEDRMRRHRWLAMETARKVGASWAEIGAAAGMAPHDARRLYEATLAGQKAFGYAEAHRADPGRPGAVAVPGASRRGPSVGDVADAVTATALTHPHDKPALSIAHPFATSSFSSSPPLLFNPRQTPLHRGCSWWASRVVVSAR